MLRLHAGRGPATPHIHDTALRSGHPRGVQLRWLGARHHREAVLQASSLPRTPAPRGSCSAAVASASSLASGAAGDQLRRDVMALMMCWETGTHAGVGAQAELGGLNPDPVERRDLLVSIAMAGALSVPAKRAWPFGLWSVLRHV